MAYLITIPIKSTTRPKMQSSPPPPPQALPSGLMNGAIRHASCPGGEQAAPTGQPGHRDGGGGRACMPELTLGRAGIEGTGGNTGNMGRAGEAQGYRMKTQDRVPATQRARPTHTHTHYMPWPTAGSDFSLLSGTTVLYSASGCCRFNGFYIYDNTV